MIPISAYMTHKATKRVTQNVKKRQVGHKTGINMWLSGPKTDGRPQNVYGFVADL
jgi:hypothetical protein